jgi:aryl-alcohol dehydrogenase
VLVRVVAAGICHTDLIMRDQWYPVPLPAVLGHEGAGIVEQVGSSVTKVAAGDRVGMTFDSCGRCPTCQVGRPSYCHNFFEHNFASSRPDGTSVLSRGGTLIHAHFFGQSSFATHAVARERNVVRIDSPISFVVAAPFCCGIQTGAGAVLNNLRVLPDRASPVRHRHGESAAVMAAVIAGATTIVGIDLPPGSTCSGSGDARRERRRARAVERSAATGGARTSASDDRRATGFDRASTAPH